MVLSAAAVMAVACLAATDNPGSSGEPPGVLVPEPATWQLLLVGGGVAAGARVWSKYRRRG